MTRDLCKAIYDAADVQIVRDEVSMTIRDRQVTAPVVTATHRNLVSQITTTEVLDVFLDDHSLCYGGTVVGRVGDMTVCALVQRIVAEENGAVVAWFEVWSE